MSNNVRVNFMIPLPLKNHIDAIAKRLTKKKDRNISVGELIRKAIINTYGKPEEDE